MSLWALVTSGISFRDYFFTIITFRFSYMYRSLDVNYEYDLRAIIVLFYQILFLA
jgi:hypothetical protein